MPESGPSVPHPARSSSVADSISATWLSHSSAKSMKREEIGADHRKSHPKYTGLHSGLRLACARVPLAEDDGSGAVVCHRKYSHRVSPTA